MAPFRGYGDLPGTFPIMPGLTGMPAYRPRPTDFIQPEDVAPAPEVEPEADSIYKRALDGAGGAYRAFESAPAVAANYYAEQPSPFQAARDLVAPSGAGPRADTLSEGLTPRLPSIRDLIESGAQTPDQPASDTYGEAMARKVGGFGLEMASSPTNAALLLATGGAGNLGRGLGMRAIPDLGLAAERGATARAALEGVELAPEALAAAGRTARYGRLADLGQRAISLGFGASMLPGAAEHLGEAAHTLESEGVNPHSVAEATGSGLEALLAGAALGHGFFPSTPARAGSARPFDERSDPASRQVFPIDEPLARNAPPPRGTPAPPVDIGAAATTMPDLGRGAIPLPDLDRMINERLARLGGGGEAAAPFTAPEAPYEVQPFGEVGHGPSPAGYQPEPPPVDINAEREFLRPNLQALADAEQARRAREFLSTPRPELRPIEPSGFTPPEEPFTVPEGPAHFEPPAGLPLPEQFLEEGVRNAMGEGGAPPRLGWSLPAISGPGAEDVSFSPRAAEAAADQGVKVEPRAEARPTISGRDDVEAARLAKNIEGTPDAELRRRETFYQRTRFKKSLSVVKDEIARRQQDSAAAPEVEAARQKTTLEQLSPAEAADVAWALGPGRGRDINSMTVQQARDLIAPMRRAKEMREAQAARAAAPAPEAQPPAEVAPAAPTVPSPAQAIAGNYPKRQVKWNGLEISVETPKGSERVAHDGSWRVPEMPADYGYVKRTVGADSEHVDVYMGDHPDADTVYVIDQKNLATGGFDEHKGFIGFPDEASARAAYERAFTDGKGGERIQDVTPMSVAQFKAWLHGGDLTKAAAETVHTPIEAPEETAKAPSDYSESIPAEEERRRDSVVDRREQDQPVATDRRLADRRKAILDDDPSLSEKAADRIARAEMRAEESDARATSAETEAGRDTLTGVESANAYRRSLKAIEAGDEPKPAKVSEFDIAGVGAGNVQIGEPYMDARLQAAGETINHVVGKAGRVFRKGGDEFVIHWNDSRQGESLHPEVAKALDQAHIVVTDGARRVAEWTGVEHYGGFGDDFNEASRALYELKPKRGTPEYKQLPKGLADKIEQGRAHGDDLPPVERGVRGSEGSARAGEEVPDLGGQGSEPPSGHDVAGDRGEGAGLREGAPARDGDGEAAQPVVEEPASPEASSQPAAAAPTEEATTAEDRQPSTPEGLRAAADRARERLKTRGKGHQANDLGAAAAQGAGTMADVSIIGADFIARGFRTFGTWGREMMRALGDTVGGLAQQLRKVWQDARSVWKGSNAKTGGAAPRAEVKASAGEPAKVATEKAEVPAAPPPGARLATTSAPEPAPAGKLTLPEETLADKTASYFQDRLRRLDVVEKSVGAQGGKVAPQGENVKAAADALGAKVAAKHEQIRQEFVDPLVKTLGDAKVPLKDLDDYVSLLHAPDRDALVAKRTDGEVKNGSGWTDAEQAQGWADLEKKYGPAKDGKIAALEPAADLVRGMRDEQMKLLQEGGLISKDQADAWRREMGENYVPMRTAEVDEGMGTGQGFDIRGKESKAATGRSTKADSPVSFMVNQLERAAVRAEKNKVDQRFADFVRENKLFEMDKEHERTELGANGKVKKVRDVLRDQQDFTYKVNGETHRIDIASVDPLLDKAMRNASVGDRNIVVDKLGTISRHFSKAVTSWNPAFMFTNFARDIQEAIGNAGVEHGAEVAKNILQGVPGAMREMYRMAKDPKKASQMARDFKADGGAVGWYSMTGVPELEKELTSRLDSNGPGVARAAKRTFQRITQSVADATGTTENATRFAVYKALRDGGASREKAAWAARNATLDFTKKGEAGPTINALYTFFNANVQGMKRLKEVAIDNPKGRALAGGIVAAGMAMDAYNRAMAGDGNKDGINDYDAIPEHVKARNWVVMRGAGKKPITIPIPYGFSIFQTVGRQIMSSYAGATTPGKAAMSVVSAANNAFNPLGGEGGLVQSLSPTFLDPFIQHATNTSWSGQPLMPDAQPGQAKPASERYFKNAPPAAIAIARWLNEKTGGDKVTPGLISVSPEVLSLYTDAANNMFGVGSYAKTGIQAAETVKSVASGETPSVRNIPVANRFVYEESPGQEGQIYRANMDELDTLWSRYNSYKKEGKADAIKAMPIGLLRAKRAVAPIDSQIDQIKKSAKAHPDKQDRADELIGELQVKANRIISEARQSAGMPANPQE